ncbi:MAG: efflux RND transporter permease subunit [Vicinamibacterales bacterium]|nr:efflux RND transporter permease subunit [Vicinamibacterales bacterium]
MWISNTSIQRPVFATMVIMSFMVLGIVSMGRLGIDLFPEVNFPFVNVTVVYPGAAPEEVETLVTRPIEDAVAGIAGVKRVISTSTEGVSRVGIELRLEVDAQAATAEVREKVAAVRGRLPREIEDPTIARFDVAALPIMIYAVGSTQPSDVTRRQIEDDLKPLIEQIDGVAAIEVNGGQVREIQVDLDPRRLEALQLPLATVAQALAASNLDVPGGQVKRDGRSIALRTKGEFQSVDEIESLILRSTGGSPVRLRDVGRVVDGFEDQTSTTRLDGADAVSFSVRKQSGSNTAAIADSVEAALLRLAPDFPQLDIRPVHNDADFIKENVREVRNHILFGGVMAVLIVFVFMRDWRSTLITSLALPTSVVATFFFMYIAGFTFNMMTLMALSLVIGILIDDAVVVRENIYRHMEMGKDPVTAARDGTSEIGLAVMATTFTILAVFLPVGFMTGIVGQFFKSFALTIAFAVAMSLLVAFTLDPMLSSRFVRFIPHEERIRTRTGRMLERWGDFYDGIDRKYHAVLGWALARPWTILGVATAVFLSSLSTLAIMGTEFTPAEDRGQYEVLVEMPPGTSFEQSVTQMAEVERQIQGIPEVRQLFSTVGVNGDPLQGRVQVKTIHKLERERGLLAIKDDTRKRLATLPLVKTTVADPEFMQGAPNEAPINVFVRGSDMDTLQRLSDEIVTKVQRIPGTVDVNSSLESGQPEMVARVNRALAADLGFDVGTIALQLRSMVEGVVPTKLREGDKEYDIRVRLAPEFRNDFDVLARAPLYSPTGALVRTSEVVTLEPDLGPTNIEREGRRRQAKIGIELDGRPLGDVTNDVAAVMATIDMPPNVEWGFAGDVELMQESAAAMGLAIILAIAFIYIVLASQFESFTEPFIIMLALPLAVVGALLGLLLTGNNLGMPAMIGIVMLMGLVTKNAILLVDMTNQYVREGHSVPEALLRAGPVRLRPILMTTMAMILGMLPSAMGRGDGSEFRSPISIATIGGLITSTLLTLVVIPVSYLLLSRFLARLKAWRASPDARLHPAVRIAGLLILVGLVGWFATAASAFGQTVAPSSLTRGAAPGLAALGAAGQDAPLVLTFDDALARAMTSNQALKVTEEEVRVGQARVSEARTAFLPSVDLTFLYTPTQRFPLIQIPAGVFGPEPQTFEAGFTREHLMQLDVSQPLYTGGRIASAYGIQAAAFDASRLGLARTRQALHLQVVQTFYAVLMHEQGQRVAAEAITLAERQLELARVRFDAGSVARLDVLRAEVDLANARARRIQARAAVETAHQALRSLLALPQSQPIQLSGTLDEPLAPLTREALTAALPARPDLRAFGAQREMADHAVSLANAQWKPSLALTGNLMYQDDGLSNLWTSNNQSYTLGVALRVPLFAAPRAAAQRTVALAQRRQAGHGLEAALDAGHLEIASAWTDLEALAEVVVMQEKALELARESVSIAQVSYENGVITSAELTDAQVALLQTESLLMQAKYHRIVAAARARFAAGIE